MLEPKTPMSAKRIKNINRGTQRTVKQWAKYYLAQLAVDHQEALNAYIAELPTKHQESVKNEIDRLARMTLTRRGFEWT